MDELEQIVTLSVRKTLRSQGIIYSPATEEKLIKKIIKDVKRDLNV